MRFKPPPQSRTTEDVKIFSGDLPESQDNFLLFILNILYSWTPMAIVHSSGQNCIVQTATMVCIKIDLISSKNVCLTIEHYSSSRL